MKKRIFFVSLVALLIAILGVTLCGCKLTADDCKFYGEDAFVSLWAEDNSKLDDNAIRIMSANVLVHIKGWGGEPVKPRAHKFAEAVKHYEPDVIAMQEMCSDWYKYLLPQLENYEVIEKKNSLFMENRSAIIYNKAKLKLIESGLKKYSQGDNNGCRAITYGVFERLSDGVKFIATSTHLDLIRQNDYEKEKAIMLNQVAEMTEVIANLNTKYPNLPIFMGGDYNSMEHENSRLDSDGNDLTYFKCKGAAAASFAYEKLIENGYIDTKFVDGIKRTFDNTRNYLYDDPTWDHIFMTNESFAQVLQFRVMTSDYFHKNNDKTCQISDHLPICVDVLVNN